MFSKFTILALLLSLSFSLQAQKETAIWHFGPKLSLDFTSGAAKFAASNTSMNVYEGCASISDRQGHLLFYTDGMRVWSADHKIMPHCLGLKGHRSSSNSALIVPRPGESNIYYIITADEGGYDNPPNDGIHYSTVNMCLNNGRGDVEESSKNTLLSFPSTEKIAAVRHSNGEDIWIMTHRWESNEFYAFLLTSEGINPQPVVSSVGTVHQGLIRNTIGQMKFSPDGKKLALCVSIDAYFEVFDFDAGNGSVSNAIFLQRPNRLYHHAYGVEFSPDGTKLYVSATTNGIIQQYDLTLPTPAQVQNSRVTIRDLGTTPLEPVAYHSRIGGMQLGMDGKIYVSKHHQDYRAIGVINSPNVKGRDCKYEDRQIITSNLMDTYYCFPAFMASYFSLADKIDYNGSCLGDSTSLWIESTGSIRSVTWQFGEAGSTYQAAGNGAIHLYANAGSYQVQATVSYQDGRSKSLTRKITVQPPLQVGLGKDTLLCAGQSLTLEVSSLQGYPLWQDGSTASTYTVTTPGTYWVEVCRGACSDRDSIVVSYLEPPKIDLGADRFICDGNPVKLTVALPFGSYLWSDGNSDQQLTVTKTGTYYVTVTTPCGQASDTVKVIFEDVPTVDLGEDLTLCVGDTLLLNVYSPQANRYRWRNLEADPAYSNYPTRAITEEGSYEVELGSANCLVADTIHVTFLECEDKLFIPNVITPNGDGKNDHFLIEGIMKGKWQLQIYNRYGKVVYSSTTYQNNWDGSTLSGNTFYYYLNNSEKKRKYKGWIQVLR